MLNKGRLAAIVLIMTLFAAACGAGSKGEDGPAAGGNSSSGSVTANRSVVAEKVLGSVLSYTETDRYNVITGEKLESDRFLYAEDSAEITMLLDSDKHVYAGEKTKLHLVATGKKGSTATRIELLEGLMVCGIDEKLGSKETFEVVTPNATLSVRGTIFTTKVERYRDGTANTNLSVSEGSIEVTTFEDGEQKTVTVGAGDSADFKGEAPEEMELPTYLIGYGVVDPGSFDIDDRFEYYQKVDGTQESGDLMDNGYPPVRRLVRGTFYDTSDYFREIIEANSDKGAYYGGMVVFSEPVTMQDGAVIEYCSIGLEDAIPWESLPYGIEMDIYGTFDPCVNSPDTLNVILFDGIEWGLSVADIRPAGSSASSSAKENAAVDPDSEKGSGGSDPSGTPAGTEPSGGNGDSSSLKQGMTYEYKITGGTRSDGEAFTAEDIDSIFKRPFMYVYVYDKRTEIEPPCWNCGDEIIGAAIERVEKGFTSGEVCASHYDSQGEMSYFVDLNVTLNGSSATIYDINAQETFYLTLIDTFTFGE